MDFTAAYNAFISYSIAVQENLWAYLSLIPAALAVIWMIRKLINVTNNS